VQVRYRYRYRVYPDAAQRQALARVWHEPRCRNPQSGEDVKLSITHSPDLAGRQGGFFGPDKFRQTARAPRRLLDELSIGWE
jgi:hypothetical protein